MESLCHFLEWLREQDSAGPQRLYAVVRSKHHEGPLIQDEDDLRMFFLDMLLPDLELALKAVRIVKALKDLGEWVDDE